MNDKEIILLVRDNPTEGLRTVIKQYSGLIKTIVQRILYRNTEDVEECVADTFIKFWETAKTLDPDDSSIKAYLICIARNLAINRYHYLKRRKVVPIDNMLFALSDETNIEDEHLARESTEVVLEAVHALPEPNREIMLRRYLLFEPIKQIASAMELTDTVVASRIQYTKTKLRKVLIEKGVTL